MNVSGYFPENIGKFLKIRNVDITNPSRIGLMYNTEDNTEDVTKDDFEIEAMTTKNTSFSLDRHGKQCGPLQYIRELTQNSIESILEDGEEGDIFWTYDREELAQSEVHKLCIIDTGQGMTGEDIRSLMNKMYSSGKKQSMDENFGIGAKIAGLFRSPKGLNYQSYKDQKGFFAELCKHPRSGEYGLVQQELEDGSLSPYLEIPFSSKPKQISGSGTKVTLIGREDDEDTFTSPPEGEQGKEWLSRYLNGRYFTFPEGITLKVTYRNNPDQIDNPNYKRRTIRGMNYFLSKYQVASGVVEVSGARMHWWVLDEGFRKQNYFTNWSHTGTLFQNEIHDLEVGSKTNRARLNRCGIIHLLNRMVIYAEPTTNGVFADASRTELYIKQGKKAPWLDWAEEFFEKIPKEISDLEDEASNRASDNDINIQAYDMLKKWLKDFEIPKFTTKDEGEINVSPPVDLGGSPLSGQTAEDNNEGTNKSRNKSGSRGRRFSDFLQDDGERGRTARSDEFIPRVDWVSPDDHPHLEDRAGSFIREHNRLLINKNYRGFTSWVIDVHKEKGGGKPGALSTVEDVCKLHWQVHLCETVMRVQMLKRGGRTWKQDEVDGALSELGLTAAVSGIGHLDTTVKGKVGRLIGKVTKKREAEIFTP